MKSKPENEYQKNLFRVDLECLLNTEKPLYKLANKIDWFVFEKEFGSTYSPNRGRPGVPIKKMVALHYLKSAYGESDESVFTKSISSCAEDKKGELSFEEVEDILWSSIKRCRASAPGGKKDKGSERFNRVGLSCCETKKEG